MGTTPWFDGSVKPVHVGPYKRKFLGGTYFSWWSGEFWCWLAGTAADSKMWRDMRSEHQHVPWRGLTKPAES